MKRILILTVLVLAFSVQAFAAGSCTITSEHKHDLVYLVLSEQD